MKYLDVSGCTGITDKTLLKLSSFYGKASRAERKDGGACQNCNCSRKTERSPLHGSSEAVNKKHVTRKLECLRLSGCYKITDEGLRYVLSLQFMLRLMLMPLLVIMVCVLCI